MSNEAHRHQTGHNYKGRGVLVALQPKRRTGCVFECQDGTKNQYQYKDTHKSENTHVSEVLLAWPFTMHDTEHPYTGTGDKVSVLSAHFQEIIPAPNRNAEKLLAAG